MNKGEEIPHAVESIKWNPISKIHLARLVRLLWIFRLFHWVIMLSNPCEDSNTNDQMIKELSYRGLTSRSKIHPILQIGHIGSGQ